MSSVGEKLRRARLDQKLDLTQLAVKTKISMKFLEAIEQDERQKLPGGFFYRSWVQQYAEALSLDAEALTSEVDQVLSTERPPALPGQEPRSFKEGRPARIQTSEPARNSPWIYSFGLLIAVILACSGVYALWRNSQVQANSTSTVVVAQPPQVANTPAPVEPKPAGPETQPAAPSEEPKKDPAATDTQTGSVPAPAEAPASTDDMKIEIAANQPTWLSISPDGKQVFSGILQPPEVKTVEAKDNARIKVGNAGGLSVTLNGKPIGPIGPEGQVRLVIIDRTNGVHIVQPRPAPPSPEADGLKDRAAVAAALQP